MKNKRWHVVCSSHATDPKPSDKIWTLSRRPREAGWNTDGGYEGYGLTKRQAQELADAANAAWFAKYAGPMTNDGW